MLSLGLRDPKAWKPAAIHATASSTTTTDHAAEANNRQRTDNRVRIDAWIGRILLLQIAVLIIGLLIAPRDAEAATAHRWCQRVDLTPHAAIDCVWPRHSRSQAHRVAECESTASAHERIARRRGLGRWAKDYANGTHWGVFQLGARERRAHGRYQLGDPALTQVRSALGLYRARGWQPWRASAHCSGVYR